MTKLNLHGVMNREARERLVQLHSDVDSLDVDTEDYDEQREAIYDKMQKNINQITADLEIDNPDFMFSSLPCTEEGLPCIAIGINEAEGVWHMNCKNGTGQGFYAICFDNIEIDDNYSINNPVYNWLNEEFNENLAMRLEVCEG